MLTEFFSKMGSKSRPIWSFFSPITEWEIPNGSTNRISINSSFLMKGSLEPHINPDVIIKEFLPLGNALIYNILPPMIKCPSILGMCHGIPGKPRLTIFWPLPPLSIKFHFSIVNSMIKLCNMRDSPNILMKCILTVV